MNSLDFEIVFVAVRVVNIGSNCLQLRYVREYAVKDCGKTSREYGECTAHQTCYYVKKCSSKAAARTKKGLKEAWPAKQYRTKVLCKEVKESDKEDQRTTPHLAQERQTTRWKCRQTKRFLRRTICGLSLRDYGRVVEGLPFRVKDALPTRHAIVCRR